MLSDLSQSSHVLSECVSLKTNADTLCSPSPKWVMVVSQPPGIQVTVTPADSRVTTASPGGGRKQGPCSSSWSLQTGCERSGSPSGRGPGPESRLLSQGLALQDPLSLGLVLLAESITWCSPALKQHGNTTFLTGHAGGRRHSAHFTGGRWRFRLKSKWYLSL